MLRRYVQHAWIFWNHLAPLWLGAMLSYPVWLDYDIWLTKEPLYGWVLRCNTLFSWIMFGGLPMLSYPWGGVMICVYLLVTLWLSDQLSYAVRLVYEVFR